MPAEAPISDHRGKSRRRLAQLFVSGILCLHLLLFVGAWSRVRQGYPDFTIFYTAARMVREGLGHQLYDLRAQYRVQEEFAKGIQSRVGPLPYIHPPFEVLI